MITQSQLEPSTPNVAAFPLSRRRQQVERVAELLQRKHGKAASAYWKATGTKLLNELVAVGVCPVEAQDEVRSFFRAVLVEMENQNPNREGIR